MPLPRSGITRRAFAATVASAAVHPLKAAPRARIEEVKTISPPGDYKGWATLARRRNGELLVACSGGREAHVCPFGRVEILRSSGSGEQWGWPEVVLDTAIDDRDAGICETETGALLVTTFTSLAFQDALAAAKDWPATQRARWEAVNRRGSAEQFRKLLGTWMVRSTDGGFTWSTPYRVPLNSPHGPSAASNRRLLYAGKQLWEPGKKVGMCESTDDGVTWRWLSDIPARPGDAVEHYHELHQVEAGDGRIIVHIRTHNKEHHRETLQCESGDGGRTWSVPHPIGVWGLPSHLLRLRNGVLVMSYGYRRAPFGNQVRISRDGAKSWSEPLTISGDGAGVDLGYPSTVETEDGTMLTVWYEQTRASPHAVLRMARWKLEI